ncbi:MAG TPA: F0F1 ATP synthase subunit delta [Candidatus Saccharimonadales bacterium]|nr:F0F1 ATP synthase subunit delta [Candidatus Saccharimonadales bacterium]
MKTSRSKIAQTIADKTLVQGASKEYAREIAAYLLSERRVGEVDSLLRDIQADWAENGYVEVLARSAHALTETEKTAISQLVGSHFPAAKQVKVSEVADPSVVGGVRLVLPNQQLDMSVDAKLNKFKQLTAAGKE